ncbi:hypothetical protein FA13DRAFT_1075798 [Coprinellus micaceus]|uniref:Nephrocystin 3-like N-terminal domain-containing protein n=1 Tax=Coprinellus micaceus TaxID=71717 RepID=A0A4Y7TR34_COPMI|nr:hypothetical protein FA13DRAFT_1075798 [Coprinellus micaceus]
MTSNLDSSHLQIAERLFSPSNGLRARSNSHEPSPSSTSRQDGFVTPPAPDERSVPIHSDQLRGMQRSSSQSSSSHRMPRADVEDRSIHHYGDNYYNSHNVHGTANYIGNVTTATLGSNSVTTIERASFSSGNAEATVLWDGLPKQRDVNGQRNEYLEGSREDTVQYVLRWGKDPKSELSLPIHGAAGLGKSTFAHHLTHRLHTAGCLGASVSLNALPSDNRGPESVAKLVSREIGEAHPGAIPSILEAIKSCKGAPLVDLVKQFIIEPVRSLGLSHPLIVLFDSIDEWESHPALIKAISSLAFSPTSVKFILLGRSDPQARGFENISIRPYPLQPVSTSTMVQYLEKQFDDVSWESGRRPAPWRIIQLAELANGLFIWATVVCSILQKRLSHLPRKTSWTPF